MAEDHLRALDAVPLTDLGGAGVAELVRVPGVPPMPVSQVGTLLIGQLATTRPLPCASARRIRSGPPIDPTSSFRFRSTDHARSSISGPQPGRGRGRTG